MPNLTKSPPLRGPTDPRGEQVTRVVVVRDQPRSVRPTDETSRFGVRTGFWASIAVGVLGFVWLTGHFGETLGLASALGVNDLRLSSDGGLATGVRMVLAVPLRIFEMAMVDPARLAIAFLLVSIPAAGLAVAKPRVPGGPRPSKLASTFATLGLIGAGLVFAILVAWIAWPDRRATLGAAPTDRDLFTPWLADASATAGFDAFALLAGILWLVLLFRLPLPRVAVGLAAVAGFVAVFASWTGFATSNGIVDGFALERPIALVTGPSNRQCLLLGELHGRSAVMNDGERPLVLTIASGDLAITGRQPLRGWMAPKKIER